MKDKLTPEQLRKHRLADLKKKVDKAKANKKGKYLTLDPELKTEIAELVKNEGYKAGTVANKLGINDMSLREWMKGKSLKKHSTPSGKARVSKTKTLIQPSRAASSSKIIGSSLREMLSNESNLVRKAEAVDNLEKAGFDREELLEHTNTLPSPEDWGSIQKAILLLSKDFNITQK